MREGGGVPSTRKGEVVGCGITSDSHLREGNDGGGGGVAASPPTRICTREVVVVVVLLACETGCGGS